MAYYEIAKGRISNRGYAVQPQELFRLIKEAQDKKEQLFRSIYTYDKRLPEHLETNKSARGFIGKLSLQSYIFDIDKNKESDEFTLQRARQFADELITNWKLDEESTAFYFSGTGYHILTPNFFGFEPSTDLPKIVKSTFETYFQECDLSFYNPSGLIRMPFTINEKTSRYKIALSWDDFFSMKVETIFELASEKPEPVRVKLNEVGPYKDSILEPLEEPKMQLKAEDPTSVVTCVQKMFNKGEEQGHRHERILRMASAFRRRGIPQEACVILMEKYAPSMASYEVEKYVKSIYEKGYSYGCEDRIMGEFCDPKCIFYRNKSFANGIINAEAMESEYLNYIKDTETSSLFNLKPYFGLENDFFLLPGYFVGIIGDSGVNKTSLAQNLSIAMKNQAPLLYISTEFGNHLLFRRYCQIAHNLDKDKVIEKAKSSDEPLSTPFSHVHFMRSTPNLPGIEKEIRALSPKTVIVDTTDDITVPGKDGVAAEKLLYTELKQMAERYRIIFIAVHHISKSAALDEKGNRRPLTKHSGSGSKAFTDKADVLLGVEPTGATTRKIKTLKGRDDPPFARDFSVDMDTFRFHLI